MKLVFKLTIAQELVALALKAKNIQATKEWLDVKITQQGDFIVPDFGYGVQSQSLEIINGTLIYEGKRTTLRDGFLDAYGVIVKIFGGREAATASLIRCESTAPHLEWWEKEEEGLAKAPLDRVARLARENTWTPGIVRSAKAELVRRLGEYEGKTGLQLAATFTKEELAAIKVAKSSV